jgi:hypothetical protein
MQYEVEWDGKWVTTGNSMAEPVAVFPWYLIPSNGADGLEDATIFAVMLELQTMNDGVVRVAFLSTDDGMPADNTPESDSALATFLIVLGPSPASINVKALFEAYGPKITAVPVMTVKSAAGYIYDTVGQPFDLPNTGLPLKMASAPSGQYQLNTTIRDFWGNAAQSMTPINYTAP